MSPNPPPAPPRPRSMLPPKRKRRPGRFARFMHRVAIKWDLKNVASIGILVLLAYGALVGAVGKGFYPPKGAFFTVLLIWSSAHLGGLLLSRLLPVMPPLLGMLAAGVLLRNVPGDAARGLSEKAASKLRYGCLAVIFLSSGLEQDPSVFKKVGAVAVRLLLFPGIVEALVAGGVMVGVFGMPPLFAIAVGFVIKPCDPAIVISTMCGYQERKAGVRKGIPSLLVAAASFDDIVAIALYTVFITLAVPSTSSSSAAASIDGSRSDTAAKIWSIAAAPLQLVFGLALGLAGAAVCSASRLFDRAILRTAAVLLCALAQMYFMVYFKFAGAGVLSSIVLGVAVAQAWGRGVPALLSSGPNETHATQVEHQVSAAWTWVAQPLLFGLVGTQVVFSKIPPAAVPRALAVIFAGWAARMPATFASVSFSHLNTKEKLFVVLNWLPKATVQAALAAAPLERVEAEMGPPEASAAAGEFGKYGEDALVTVLLSVLICGPLGVALVALLGPMLVKPDDDEEGGEEERAAGKLAGARGDAITGSSSSVVSGGRAAITASTGHLRRLGSDAASALAAMPAASVGGRAWQLMSMPTVLPAATRTGGGVGSSVAGGGAGGGGGAGAANVENGAAEEEEHYEDDDEDELERLRREDVDDAYADALLADVDPRLHSLLQEVELEAWQLEAAAGSAPVGRAAAAAAAGRLRAASAGLRRRMLEREPGRIASVDGAREFFRRLETTSTVAVGGAGGGAAGGQGSAGTV